VKGAVVGLQWALRMHGFDDNAPEIFARLMNDKKKRMGME
jgi:hypothetical protein